MTVSFRELIIDLIPFNTEVSYWQTKCSWMSRDCRCPLYPCYSGVCVWMVWFVLFRDTWSRWGQSASCITILHLNLQITRSDFRPHIKWAVRLVIAYGHFNLHQGFVWVCMSTILTLSSPRGWCVCGTPTGKHDIVGLEAKGSICILNLTLKVLVTTIDALRYF